MSAMLAETGPDEASAIVEAPHRERKRVVIIGAGFAGIAAARALRRADVDVVVVDRRNHHIFSAAALPGGDGGALACRDRRADPAARGEAAEYMGPT